MKKIKIVALMLAVFTLLAGCGNTSTEVSENTQEAATPIQSETASEDPDANRSDDQNTMENATENAGSNALIAYFSRIGNIDSEHEIDAVSSASVVTQGEDILGNMEYIAQLLQDVTGGDIHFIQTSKQYPSDYDSSDNNELDVYVNKENRENARPELATHVETGLVVASEKEKNAKTIKNCLESKNIIFQEAINYFAFVYPDYTYWSLVKVTLIDTFAKLEKNDLTFTPF